MGGGRNILSGRHFRSPRLLRFSIFLFGFFAAPAAYAGAWLEKPGTGLVIAQTNYSSSDKVVDASGNKTSQRPYRQWGEGVYAAYGVNDRITAGLSGNAIYSQQYQPALQGDAAAAALTDPSLFVKYGIWREGPRRLSVQGTWQLPRQSWQQDGLTLGNPNYEYELAIQYGESRKIYGYDAFLDTHLGYRVRAGNPDNQFRTNLTLGVTPVERWQILGQAFGTWRSDRQNNPGFTQSSGDDYDQLRLQASLLWQATDAWYLQAGYFQDVYGRNFGLADGGLIGIWRTF